MWRNRGYFSSTLSAGKMFSGSSQIMSILMMAGGGYRKGGLKWIYNSLFLKDLECCFLDIHWLSLSAYNNILFVRAFHFIWSCLTAKTARTGLCRVPWAKIFIFGTKSVVFYKNTGANGSAWDNRTATANRFVPCCFNCWFLLHNMGIRTLVVSTLSPYPLPK